MFVNNCLQSQNQKNEEREGRVGDVRLKLLQQMRGFRSLPWHFRVWHL